MSLDDYNVLSEILNELRQEKKDIDEKLQHNICCIKGEEVYAKTFIESEPDDFKIFSPRNMESLYKDEIEKSYDEKKFYENENKNLYCKRDVLSSRIERIENILKSENNNLTVLNIQEEDRQRIARDLHDTSLQNLAHLVHQIELSGLYIDQDPIRAKLELSIVNKRLRETIDEIRNTIFDLRPMTFDDLGLKATFERFVDSINENNQYEVELDLDDVSCETNLVLVTIYRVVQECFNNIIKHAEATKIYFSCKCIDNNCRIVIKDDGNGLTESKDDGKKHFGIFCMKERVKLLGGTIQIDFVPDAGTTVSIDIPLNPYNSNENQ